VANIENGRYSEGLNQLKASDEEALRQAYQQRELEPASAGEDWTPKETAHL
jgi:hypothetical protein